MKGGGGVEQGMNRARAVEILKLLAPWGKLTTEEQRALAFAANTLASIEGPDPQVLVVLSEPTTKPMNLGERNAYDTGRKDGWQEAIVALAGGAKKILGPEATRGLLAALQGGLTPATPATPATITDDPTEPASWVRSPGPWAPAVESAPGEASSEAHRDLVHRALAMPRDVRRRTTVAFGGDWHGTRPGDEDRHTVGEHR